MSSNIPHTHTYNLSVINRLNRLTTRKEDHHIKDQVDNIDTLVLLSSGI
jgi:hypothetical protein